MLKKYFRAGICIGFTSIKLYFMKIFHASNLSFKIPHLISPKVVIEMGKGSKLNLQKMVRARSGSKLCVRSGAELSIGYNTGFNHGCLVISHHKIEIGKNCQFGPNVLIYDHDHDFRNPDGVKALKYKTSPVVIGDNVWIGANTVILRGTIIGDNTVIGAGSVIKGTFPNDSIVVQKRENQIISY
ncbi:acyltransferase [Bacillus cereus]|uniref:acyltransferase n=1 Tax=Bacillus TaxID=1386 RepID=UPI0009B53A6C|nr:MULTISPECIES: acyltransferase [Bacillus cereus group]HCX49141.1 acyltransferase [Bacillus sp. (in: firmicutes)]ASI86346.1 Galactoside O-acetyltransferase [Bacillus cereus]MCU5332765.1 acyltransferase [Bacillus cereus]MDA1770115.1 acyltransferase [Bacillus cereus]MDW4538609.1 acyltransferase [Bacillus cereus]